MDDDALVSIVSVLAILLFFFFLSSTLDPSSALLSSSLSATVFASLVPAAQDESCSRLVVVAATPMDLVEAERLERFFLDDEVDVLLRLSCCCESGVLLTLARTCCCEVTVSSSISTTDVFFLRRDERYKLFDLLLPDDEGATAVVGLVAELARLLDPTGMEGRRAAVVDEGPLMASINGTAS